MGLFDIFRKKDKAQVVEAPPCPHTAIVPRWDNADDMGKEDKVTAFYCQACGQTFTPEEMNARSGLDLQKLRD